MEADDADTVGRAADDRRDQTAVSRPGEASVFSDSQLRCKTHNKMFEAIVPEENRLMWPDCVKSSNKKTQKIPIGDMNLLILSNISENSEELERFKIMLLIKKSIQDLLRKFFKSMHEMLYEIESSKKKQFEYIIKSLFGALINSKSTIEMFDNLKSTHKSIDKLIKEK